MKLIIAIAALLVLVACSTATNPNTARAISIGCTFDRIIPGAVATVGAIATISDPAFAATAAQMNQADQLAHATVQAACHSIPGTPDPLVVATPGVAAPAPGTPIMLPPS